MTKAKRDLRADQIEEYLRDRILKGHFEAGERVPSERELAQRFKTGRNSVREAMRSLERLGLIATGRGGNRVRPLREASAETIGHLIAVDPAQKPVLIRQMAELIVLLCPFAARRAVEHGDTDDLEQIAAQLRQLCADRVTAAAFRQRLYAINEAILGASQSLVLMLMIRPVIAGLEDHLSAIFLVVGPELEEITPGLQRIADAIDRRDGDAVEAEARQIMAAYMAALDSHLES